MFWSVGGDSRRGGGTIASLLEEPHRACSSTFQLAIIQIALETRDSSYESRAKHTSSQPLERERLSNLSLSLSLSLSVEAGRARGCAKGGVRTVCGNIWLLRGSSSTERREPLSPLKLRFRPPRRLSSSAQNLPPDARAIGRQRFVSLHTKTNACCSGRARQMPRVPESDRRERFAFPSRSRI